MDHNNNDYLRIMSVGRRRGLPDQLLLTEANAFAEHVHKDEIRFSGEPFITHPWAVARIIADMGLETDLIAAALLHDVLEHGASPEDLIRSFNPEIVKVIQDLSIPRDRTAKQEYRLAYRERFVDAINSNYDALYIKLAGRIHNLQTIGSCSKKAQSRNIQETRDFYLPLAKRRHLSYLCELLNDACMQAEYPQLYREVSNTYHKLLKANRIATTKTRNLFKSAFVKKADLNSLLSARAQNVWDCIIRQRHPIAVYDSVKWELSAQRGSCASLITKYKIPLYDILLIADDCWKDKPIDLFIPFYRELFVKNAIIITDACEGNSYTPGYYLLQDRYQNLYRLFLYRRSDYALYMYGDNPKENLYLSSSSTAEAEHDSVERITVYTKDNEKRSIQKGATVLDFAFLIHENVGLCAKHGLVNGERAPLEAVLRDRDTIEIVTEGTREAPVVRACFSWFDMVKTPRARRYLVRWFESNYVPKQTF